MIGLIFVFSIVAHCATGDNPALSDTAACYIYQNKIDSFSYHYEIVDSVLRKNVYDTSAVFKRSIDFMERLTGIKAHPDGDYIGWRPATKMDLLSWRKWYQKHKHEQR